MKGIRVMYTNTQAKALSADGKTERAFEGTTGVLQSDTPFLFIIVVDYTMRYTLGEHAHLGLARVKQYLGNNIYHLTA